MSLLMVSETAMMAGSKLKRDHDTVNGIIKGYYPPGRMLTYPGVTKPVSNFGQPGQSESDQVTAQVGHASGPTWSVHKLVYREEP
ncbi:hypothetical protein ES703_118419 [subsurface metagenome]